MLNPLRLRRTTAALLAALLLLHGAPSAFAAEEDIITISSPEDLAVLAKNCSLDSWSQGRTVVLTADIQLSVFTPIPTFGGVFDGQGHTISGMQIISSGSSMGLFRTLQEGAVVRDLTVSGTVAPSGSACQAGGIAGVNFGSIQNCVFQGAVHGDSNVGGIVGRNRESGEIAGCSVSGQISGSSATGGIAGENRGLLLQCSSSADVNTISPDAEAFLPDLDVAALTNPSDSGEGLLSSHSDTGGIAGLSSGIVQSCVNSGNVGYPHVGYNVGGIAGRQNGFLSGCTNNGAVYGRKDVGGIAGQAEPDIVLAPGAETLEKLQNELNSLGNLIDRSLDSANAQGDQISLTLSALGGYTESAKDHAHTLLEQTESFADGNLAQLNTLTTAATAALDRLTPALEVLSETGDLITSTCDQLRGVLDAMQDAGTITDEALDLASRCLERLEDAGGSLTDAVDGMRKAAQQLQDAIVHHDPVAERKALNTLADAMNQMATGYLDAQAALSDLADAVQNHVLDRGALRQLFHAIASMGEAARQTAHSLAVLAESISLDFSALEDSLPSLSSALEALRTATRSFSSAMHALRDAADEMSGLSEPMEAVRNALLDALDSGEGIGSHLEDAFAGMADAVNALRDAGDIAFLPLGSTFHDAGSGLYAAASGLNQELENLHSDVDTARSSLSGNLQAINRQASVVTDLLLDAMTEIKDGTPAKEILSDSSDLETLDVNEVRQGKVVLCVNSGSVEGDRNVGGIVGEMGIEYDLDPEEDLQRFSLGSTYETRDVLQENINQGTVCGKKDCVGGVTGRMDLGAAADCQSYGSVTSSSGSYVGGIVGWAESTIRGCWAKCVVSGEDDVGGIAGWAVKIRDCCAITTVSSGRSRVGAIAGDADLEGGGIAGNRFVDTGTAGIDGVSYAGAAEPAPFADLSAEPGVPAAFTSFTLSLVADGDVTASIPFQYGQDLTGMVLPEVPEKEGTYGRWPEFDTSGLVSDITAEAIYTPWAALVASAETLPENGPSLALAEGQFTQDAVLHVQESSQTPPLGGGEVWEVSLSGSGLPADAIVPLRLLDRSGSGKVQQFTDGRWQSVETEVNGSYLLLEMAGLSGIFCVLPAQKNLTVPLVAVGAGLVLLLAVRGIKRKRKKKKKSPPVQSP